MRKSVLILAGCIVLVIGGLYMASGLVLSKVTDKVLNTVLSYGQTDNFKILQPHYSNVYLAGLDGIVWKGISFEAMIMDPKGSRMEGPFNIWIETVTLKALSLSDGLFLVSGIGIQAEGDRNLEQDNAVNHLGRLEDAAFSSMFYLNIFSPEQAVDQFRQLARDLKGFLQNGFTDLPVQFDGTIVLPVKNTEVPIRMQIIQEEKKYILILNIQSLKNLSTAMEEVLTEPEIILFSRNPFKAPRLFRIRDDAEKTAEIAGKHNETVSEDAYRHVLWSYLLTKAFGPDFAREVTDAHERGLTDNTEAEHRMDYNNNRIGREYALNGYKREEILSRLRQDAAVILSAQ